MKEIDELSDEIEVLRIMASENPCKMQASLISSLTASVRGLFSHYLLNGASRESVARYFGVDVRTLTRWRSEYSDFPSSGHFGHREISYSWTDVIRWKLKHKDLFEKKIKQ